MNEDKQKILNLLLPALQATEAGEEVTGIIYDDSKNAVNVAFCTGFQRTIKISGSFGITAIHNIAEYLGGENIGRRG